MGVEPSERGYEPVQLQWDKLAKLYDSRRRTLPFNDSYQKWRYVHVAVLPLIWKLRKETVNMGCILLHPSSKLHGIRCQKERSGFKIWRKWNLFLLVSWAKTTARSWSNLQASTADQSDRVPCAKRLLWRRQEHCHPLVMRAICLFKEWCYAAMKPTTIRTLHTSARCTQYRRYWCWKSRPKFRHWIWLIRKCRKWCHIDRQLWWAAVSFWRSFSHWTPIKVQDLFSSWLRTVPSISLEWLEQERWKWSNSPVKN